MTNGHVRLGKHFCVSQIRVRAPPRIRMEARIGEQLSSNILKVNLPENFTTLITIYKEALKSLPDITHSSHHGTEPTLLFDDLWLP